MSQTTRTFRIFVSSTFSDLMEERNALQKFVFPRLRELCMQHGCRFQAVDLRWGVRQEAGLDQQTMKICLDEVGRSQRASPKPNFIVLLGDRYGWRPLPAEIPGHEFEEIEKRITDRGDRELVRRWYRRDDNARFRSRTGDSPQPLFCLQPRKHEDRLGEFAVWESEIERPLRRLLLKAIKSMGLSKHERLKYEASATEQEIAAGALQVPDANEHVFCFFREITNLPEDQRAKDFVDLDKKGTLDSDACTRLADLKGRLEERLPGNIHHYNCEWTNDGVSTAHIGQLPSTLEDCLILLEDNTDRKMLCIDAWKRLARIILDEITRLEHVEPLEKEIADHRAFGESGTRTFVGRASILQTIVNYAQSADHHPLAVFGEPGSGKSVLMAKAMADCRSLIPHCQIVSRFIGATPASSDGRALLESLCREISRSYGADETSVPSAFEDLVKDFPQRLALAMQARPLVLFLDALDQLSDANHARNLIWLPGELPEHARVIVSTLPGECHSALENKIPAACLVKLEPMTSSEGRELLQLWLDDAARTLQPRQSQEVLSKFAGCGLPLYLKLAFEEALRWKSYSDDIHLAEDIPGIIRQLFTRLESDANHGATMVARSLGYLAAAKGGLSEDELLDVLSRDAKVYANFLSVARHIPSDLLPQLTAYLHRIGEPRSPLDWLASTCADKDRFPEHIARLLEQAPGLQLPVVLWSRLYFDLEPYLTERSADGASLLGFYHRQLREVAEAKFLSGNDKPARHAHLASYFSHQDLFEPQKKTPNLRKLSELPYQQTYGEKWDELHATLTDFDFLEAKLTHVAVITSGKGESAKPIYGGVYELQEDYRRALEKFPA